MANALATAALVAVAFSATTVNADSLNFVTIGDWGKPGSDQTAVAEQMGVAAEKIGASFVLALGDNFYENGVSSVSDPQWKTTWEEVYTAKSLTSVPWYAILGNHDYHQNPQAEVDFQNGTQWHMPARWYTKSFQTPDGASVDFVFIDTVNLAGTHTTVKYEELYAEGRITDDMLARWREYVDSGRQAADAQSQLDWIKATLAASTADWLFVCGHYPIYSAGEHGNTILLDVELLPVMKQYNVDTYFDGHDHVLEHLYDGDIHYVVSGNGAKEGEIKSHPSQLVWGVMDPGFTKNAVNKTHATTTFVDHTGKEIYEFTQAAKRNV